MNPFNDTPEAEKAYQLHLRENWATLPAEVKELAAKNDGPGINPNDRVGDMAELMYANRTKAGLNNKATRELIGRTAGYLGGLGTKYFRDGRGYAMMRTMMRDNGEPLPKGAAPYPAKADDPEPSPEVVPPAADNPADPAAAKG